MFDSLPRLIAVSILSAWLCVPAPLLAAGVGQSVMPVSAIVQPSAAVKLVVVPINISISTEDIARGYIDVPVGSLLSVKAGQALPPVIIDFSMGDGVFRSVEVRDRDSAKPGDLDAVRRTDLAAGNDDTSTTSAKKTPGSSADVAIDEPKKSPESTDAAATSGRGESSAALAYRFRLSDKARPGKYQVPIVLNITF